MLSLSVLHERSPARQPPPVSVIENRGPPQHSYLARDVPPPPAPPLNHFVKNGRCELEQDAQSKTKGHDFEVPTAALKDAPLDAYGSSGSIAQNAGEPNGHPKATVALATELALYSYSSITTTTFK